MPKTVAVDKPSARTLAKKARPPTRRDLATKASGKPKVSAVKSAVKSAPAKTTATKKPATKATPAEGGIKKSRRFRPGTVALREIRKYRGVRGRDAPWQTAYLMRFLSFDHVMRDCAKRVSDDMGRADPPRFAAGAVLALQTICEAFLTKLYEDAGELAIYSNRVGIQAKDVQMVLRMRGETEYTPPAVLAPDMFVTSESIGKKKKKLVPA